jgi:hypothetical protein
MSLITVINSTYIHLRVRGSYIYMYRKGRIYKEPPEKYNNRKTNTYLIPPQNHGGSTTLSLKR